MPLFQQKVHKQEINKHKHQRPFA